MSEAKVLSSRTVYKGGHIQVREDRVVEPAGHEASREIVVHPGAVCIVARPTPEDVILIRQYRHAAGSELVEIPAGTLHAGEDPRECAIRELEEEAGYLAATMPDQKYTAELDVNGTTPFFKIVAGGTVDPDPKPYDRVSFDVTSGKPYLRLKANTGHGVVQLSEDANGSGGLYIAKPDGFVVAEMSISKDKVGRVEARPLGNPLGSFIVGVGPAPGGFAGGPGRK